MLTFTFLSSKRLSNSKSHSQKQSYYQLRLIVVKICDSMKMCGGGDKCDINFTVAMYNKHPPTP